ncbi:MAG TPA: PspC domain-containing protein, partial [Patescibacteria group bacterium]|nr:PspC domain-containing protein [Patescibacteria group bacterium]
MNDRLYRSRDERIFAGVAGGVAERFDLDPSLVRIVWVVLMFVTGSLFFWLYVVMAVVVPESPTSTDRWAGWTTTAAPNGGGVPGWRAPGASGAAFAAAGPPSSSPGDPGETPAGEAGALVDVAPPAEPGPVVDQDPSTGPAAEARTGLEPGPAAPPPATGSSTPAAWSAAPPPGWNPGRDADRRGRRGGGAVIGGLVLILLGGYFFIRTVAPQFDLGAFWPVIFIVIGVALVIGSFRP